MALREQLRDTFIATLKLAPDVDVADLHYHGHERWDSLGHMALVVAIEERFDVTLSPSQLITMTTFDAAMAILTEAGAGR